VPPRLSACKKVGPVFSPRGEKLPVPMRKGASLLTASQSRQPVRV